MRVLVIYPMSEMPTQHVFGLENSSLQTNKNCLFFAIKLNLTTALMISELLDFFWPILKQWYWMISQSKPLKFNPH